LEYLKRLPAQTLKIDQSFIRDLLDDPEDLAITEGILGLARAFQRTPIAEGVETIEHETMLLNLGCDLAQGYAVTRPIPPEQLPEWAASYHVDERWQEAAAMRMHSEDSPLQEIGVRHKVVHDAAEQVSRLLTKGM
jgi:predicted signal transduction protein with EAL and GGDEF domain